MNIGAKRIRATGNNRVFFTVHAVGFSIRSRARVRQQLRNHSDSGYLRHLLQEPRHATRARLWQGAQLRHPLWPSSVLSQHLHPSRKARDNCLSSAKVSIYPQ